MERQVLRAGHWWLWVALGELTGRYELILWSIFGSTELSCSIFSTFQTA